MTRPTSWSTASALTLGMLLAPITACGPAQVGDEQDAQSSAAETATATRTYQWHDIVDRPYASGALSFTIRLANQVAYDNGKATYVRGYAHLYCWDHGKLHACSTGGGELSNSGTDLELVGFQTTNTGADGAYDVFTKWQPIKRCTPYSYYRTSFLNTSQSPFTVGLAGVYFSVSPAGTASFDPGCP